MKRRDYRQGIIPTYLTSKDLNGETFETQDLIYIEDEKETYEDGLFYENMARTTTDYSETERSSVSYLYKTKKAYWLRTGSTFLNTGSYIFDKNEQLCLAERFICPALHYRLPKKQNEILFLNSDESQNIDNYEFCIGKYKDRNEETYYTLEIGAYPQTKVEKEKADLLENLYNKKIIKSTGRWYTTNIMENYFIEKHIPEFEYEDNLFAREIGVNEKVIWYEVEPIQFVILNWDDMPKMINPKGNGKANFFDLRAVKLIISGISFAYNNQAETSWKNSRIRSFLNGINLKIFENEETIQKCSFLNEAFNLLREPITEYELFADTNYVEANIFEGCDFLEKLIINPYLVVDFYMQCALEDLNFKYVYFDKNIWRLVFVRELPQCSKIIYNHLIELKILNEYILNCNISIIREPYWIKSIKTLIEKLQKVKFQLPNLFVEEIFKKSKIYNLLDSLEFKFYCNEFYDIKKELKEICIYYEDFLKLALILGCFDNTKMLDKKGKETETVVAQKATSVLLSLIKKDKIFVMHLCKNMSNLNIDLKASQDFLCFISLKSNKKELSNFNILYTLENRYQGIFIKIMCDFNKAKLFRNCVDEKGKPKKLSWSETFEKYYLWHMYDGVNNENYDIAILFLVKGLPQTFFEEACVYRKKAINNKVQEHILGKPLKEENLIDTIEQIMDKNMLEKNNIMNTIYEKKFTYEWLSKLDAKNYILGLYCNCCANINSFHYGKEIVISSVLKSDVQNLVVKNIEGEIIAKGTIYVNRQGSYAVFNDFELNEQYKTHQNKNRAGIYEVSEDSREEMDRELIFKAFLRGMYAFIVEYNKENPNNVLKQVNVGMDHNRLKKQVKQFEEEKYPLNVPEKYYFKDAKKEQRILYKVDQI